MVASIVDPLNPLLVITAGLIVDVRTICPVTTNGGIWSKIEAPEPVFWIDSIRAKSFLVQGALTTNLVERDKRFLPCVVCTRSYNPIALRVDTVEIRHAKGAFPTTAAHMGNLWMGCNH